MIQRVGRMLCKVPVSLTAVVTVTLAMTSVVPCRVTAQDAAWQEAEKKLLDELKKTYGLKEGEYVKRIAPPYSPERLAYLRAHPLFQRHDPAKLSLLFRFRDGLLKWHGSTIGSNIETSLTSITSALNLYNHEIEGDSKDVRAEGDFVIREGAPVDKIIEQLQDIYRNDCKLPVKLTFLEVERPVFVARGSYKLTPVPGRSRDTIEIYGNHIVEDSGAGGGSGDFAKFLKWVGDFIDRRVLGELENPPKGNLSWRLNRRSPFTEQMELEDTDPDLVVQHLREQTGLEFKAEMRKVRVLLAFRAE